ncbi:TAXI family TRAP transporter solute-binding subunit [Brevibacterium aurantiacum]|uniref:TAXI family TRAP transporter solute-binding subunit n=1 Tax=Brevibacterium aurantiacum TaxID=273384 RepID=A0A556CCD1_BREAU|nr:TAXI family TRAP transporter solute-binding subunit [Brevibacterium aurantiacum]TSI15091.1 TAXI family TRAP transporter solute-binding subunit [Brevibacterium aurantiacum]
MKRTRMFTITASAVAAVLALSSCGGKQEAKPAGEGGGDCTAASGQITVATGNSTGVYYVLGGGLAQIISDNSDLKATAAETGASVQNLQQLSSGDYDVAFSLADTAADAVNGDADFKKPEDISALTRIYSNFTHVVVRKDAGIESVKDFKGKTISTGSPKSGTEVIANRLIETAGLKKDDVTTQRLDLTKTVDGMKDGTIDGMVWSGGLPTAGVTDLFTSNGKDVEFIDITKLEDPMKEINPVYEVEEIPADTYKGVKAVKTIVTPNVLMVRNDMDEGTACALTKLIYDKKADLEKVHAAAKEIEVENAETPDPIKLHPGSKKALEELNK